MIYLDLVEFSKKYIFGTTVAAWIIAQSIKVLLGVLREKRFNFRWFVGTGGMPSSRAAGGSALSTSVGVAYGFDSALFAVTLVFTLVVLFDSQGVRFSTGKMAGVLNRMLEDIYWKKRLDDKQLKEFLGHTPIEVFAGIALGLLVS